MIIFAFPTYILTIYHIGYLDNHTIITKNISLYKL